MQGVIAVSGPDSYVSPDWYGEENQVPTWNYVAVHLIGRLEPLPQEALRDLLDRESDLFESRLLPKPIWRAEKMEPDALEKLLRMIVPCRFQIDEIDGTWKLGQNKTDDMRRSAAEAMEDAGIGADVARIAQMMRDA
jgi:transcriptional regulator